MYVSHPPRAVSAIAATTVTALMLAVLVFGFGPPGLREEASSLLSVNLDGPPPTPKPKEMSAERKTDRKAAPKDEAGKRNLKNEATAIVAPPVVPLKLPPPVVTAPIANFGNAEQTGASPLPGPGQGAGTRGDGLGGGGLGGDGDGSGDGEAVQGPRRIAGRIAFRDLPENALAMGEEAEVFVVYTVEADGSVSRCRPQQSSGYTAIDHLTCRLIEERFRFRPALDRRGRAVASQVRETHSWFAREG